MNLKQKKMHKEPMSKKSSFNLKLETGAFYKYWISCTFKPQIAIVKLTRNFLYVPNNLVTGSTLKCKIIIC